MMFCELDTVCLANTGQEVVWIVCRHVIQVLYITNNGTKIYDPEFINASLYRHVAIHAKETKADSDVLIKNFQRIENL